MLCPVVADWSPGSHDARLQGPDWAVTDLDLSLRK